MGLYKWELTATSVFFHHSFVSFYAEFLPNHPYSNFKFLCTYCGENKDPRGQVSSVTHNLCLCPLYTTLNPTDINLKFNFSCFLLLFIVMSVQVEPLRPS